jgi:heptosyltransferase-3
MKKLDRKKFLFITLSNIGDAIMTTPVLEFVHNKNPDFEVDIVCDQKSQAVFKNCPYINQIIIKNKKEGLYGVLKLIQILRKNKYEIAIDLRTNFLLYFINAKKKFFPKKNNKIHSVEKHFLALNNNHRSIPRPRIWLSKSDSLKAKKILGNSKKRILAIGIGANSVHKIWPVTNFLYLSHLLKKNFDLIVLLGNSKDAEFADKFMNNTNLKVINLCGKLSLNETSSIMNLSDFFIGNDSGLGHIASALELPSFTLFDREDARRYHPWGKKACWYQDITKNINEIDPNLVYKKIIKMI